MTIKICDICGKKDAITIDITTGRQMSAAGSVDDRSDSFDLCADHLKNAFNSAIKLLSDPACRTSVNLLLKGNTIL